MIFFHFFKIFRYNPRIHIKSQILQQFCADSRHKFWVFLVSISLLIMLFFLLLKVPLKSTNRGTPAFLLKKLSLKKMGEKYAKRSVQSKTKLSEKQSTQLITKIFKKVDTNDDKAIQATELTAWIVKKVKNHLTSALKQNFFIFTTIDQNPRNGAVSWPEYLAYFLKNHGYDEEFIEKHKESMQDLPREVKERIMRDKAAWSEASRDNPDSLSIDEFLAFQHPESSHADILTKVDETMSILDVDGDGTLSEDEFADPDLNEAPDGISPEEFRKERIKEFRDVIDEDKNGKIERKEFTHYVDPRHPHHSEKEALGLIGLSDMNEDGELSLPEILMNKEFFMQSKMVSAAKSFHGDE